MIEDLALPTARDLDALPDGTTIEHTRGGMGHGTLTWHARAPRVPFVRFWHCQPGPSPDRVAATSSILAAQLWGYVLDHGDVAIPVVTLPEQVPA